MKHALSGYKKYIKRSKWAVCKIILYIYIYIYVCKKKFTANFVQNSGIRSILNPNSKLSPVKFATLK